MKIVYVVVSTADGSHLEYPLPGRSFNALCVALLSNGTSYANHAHRPDLFLGGTYGNRSGILMGFMLVFAWPKCSRSDFHLDPLCE